MFFSALTTNFGPTKKTLPIHPNEKKYTINRKRKES